MQFPAILGRILFVAVSLGGLLLASCSQTDRSTSQTKPRVSAGQPAQAKSAQGEADSTAEKKEPAQSQAAGPTPKGQQGSQPARTEAPLGASQDEPQLNESQREPSAAAGKPSSEEKIAGAAGIRSPQAVQPAEPTDSSPQEAPGFLREPEEELPFPFEIPPQWKRLSEKEEIWIDSKEKLVAVSGRICLTRGLLEMFACPKGTKEHESIVATKPWAMYVHQALLLAGVNPGRTVQWEPEYKPAEGPKILVEVWFFNEQKELVKRNAKEMVRLVADGSPLKIDWVFGGSKFLTDPDGRELYAANGGELVCLSNFSSAMIDLPIPSTAESGGLLFEANPEQIPPLNSPVLLVLKAQPAAGAAAGSDTSGEKGQPDK